jgi:HK97 gp10 family phage protein
MKIALKITGVERLASKLNSMPDNIRTEIDKELTNIGVDIVRGAVGRCPVRTGALRRSIRMSKEKSLSVTVSAGGAGTGVTYSIYVEKGTKNMRAQPYMYPALLEVKGNIPSRIKDAMLRARDRSG